MTAENIVDPEVLERLQQYGERWLDEKDYDDLKKKTKSQRRNEMTGINIDNSESGIRSTKPEIISRRQKKKMKQKQNKLDSELLMSDEPNKLEGKKAKKQRQLEELKSDLGLSDAGKCFENGQTDELTDSHSHKPEDSSAEVIVFVDPAKRKKTEKQRFVRPAVTRGNQDDQSDDGMNLRDARFDVKMFGIKGFQNADKESAVQDWLIKLGAKPPKSAYYNYKQYMEMRKEDKLKGKDRLELRRQFGVKKSSGDKKRRRRGDGIGYLDGQIGSYKSGVQVLRKHDINKVKRSKVRK